MTSAKKEKDTRNNGRTHGRVRGGFMEEVTFAEKDIWELTR